jgi:C4-type Zn-finger protein
VRHAFSEQRTDGGNESVAVRASECPLCGYDLHDRQLPTVCSECGFRVSQVSLLGPIPWERQSGRYILRV